MLPRPLRVGLGALVAVSMSSVLAAACGSSGKASTSGSGGATASSTGAGPTTGGSVASSSVVASSSTGATGGGMPDGGGVDAGDAGPGCGYLGQGTPLHVAPNLDVCLPPVVCNAETCPPPLGQCVSGKCVFSTGYEGVATLPEAWATHYCALSMGGCHGVTQIDFPEVTAQAIGTQTGHPLCDVTAADGCIGIMASSPMMVGNSQLAVDPVTQAMVKAWGAGLTEASGLCYQITGPGGTALVALTDRCGGYCKCNGSGFEECGPCVNAPSLVPNCPCVGTAGSLYTQCCGLGCGGPVVAECDWCATNNHPHFDLDDGTFNFVCGAQAGNGSCQLTKVGYVQCLGAKAWPPGGGGGTCGAGSFQCNATPAAHQDAVPGGSCCCNYDQCPQTDGSCAARLAACKAGSCACGAGEPDAQHPKVAATGCCCT